ncbi:MAG: hypothetical protein V1743_03550 [Nanoarchaeota archaeon]
MKVREASFALRVVHRRGGDAAILYRRRLTQSGKERLDRIAQMSPLAFSAGSGLLRAAVRGSGSNTSKLASGPFYPLDGDWGARVGCYGKVASGLRDAGRLHKAATNLQHADGTEAAWWLGLMMRPNGLRSLRALRILIEAVK